MQTIDWKNLPFGYVKTDYNVRCYYRDGKWGEIEVSSSEIINLHMSATCLHYGQEAFEGLKAYRGKDGKIRIFAWEENAERLLESAKGLLMAGVPVEIFKEAIIRAVQLNAEYIPPYESGASLYIRPMLIGTGAQVGVKPSNEYLFMVFVTPVGPYFKAGFCPTDIVILRHFDRAAPYGTGNIKVGGNYASGMVAGEWAHNNGFSAVLYLDAREKKYIDECGPANFFGIKNNTYITPKSSSILPSITNKKLMTLAKEMGLTVEQRQVPVEELSTFEEAGQCGTAAVISPVKRVLDYDNNIEYIFGKDGQPGEVSLKLYNRLREIQYGDAPDIYNWVTIVEE